MKNGALLLLAFSCMFFSCEKQGYGPVVKGKLVYSSCASDVIQILDASQYHLGQPSWQQTTTSPVYKNVFVVRNTCSFRKQGLSVGAEFSFQLTNVSDKDCVICQLWDNPPRVNQKIVVVSK